MTKEDVLHRIAAALADLESLSEVGAGRLAGRETGVVVNSSREGDTAPSGPGRSEFDSGLAAADGLGAKLEEKARAVRKGIAADERGQRKQEFEEKPEGKAWWLLRSGNYEGVEFRIAAEKLGMEEATVTRLRTEAGLTAKYGRAARKRGPKPTASV